MSFSVSARESPRDTGGTLAGKDGSYPQPRVGEDMLWRERFKKAGLRGLSEDAPP
jgi:hypothetical protein